MTVETILMLGDSLIEWGDWEELLPGYITINRGSAGETTGGLAARMAGELNRVDDPERIVIFSGTNDLLMGDKVFPAIFGTMLPLVRSFCPQSAVVVAGLAPMPMANREVEEVNAWLKDVVREAGYFYLDLFEPFHLYCRPVGNPCFLADGVHFSPHGYRVFARSLTDVLKTRS